MWETQAQVEGYDCVLPIAQVIFEVKDLEALTAAEEDSMNYFYKVCTGQRKEDVSKGQIEADAVLHNIIQKTAYVVRGAKSDLPPPHVPTCSYESKPRS